MKLGADHVVIEPNGHDGTFQWNMRPFFFYAEDLAAHLPKSVVIGLNDLVIATVYGEEWVFQSPENGLHGAIMQHMHGENPEGGRLSFGHMPDPEITAGELERMTNEENLLLDQSGGIFIPFFDLVQPMEIPVFPCRSFAIQWTARSTARNVDVEAQVRYLTQCSDVEGLTFYIDIVVMPVQVKDLMYAAHPLVGEAFVEIEYRYADAGSFFRLHRAKIANEGQNRQPAKRRVQVPARKDSWI
jgi:hypothetical protein